MFQAIILCHFQENLWTKLEKVTKNLIFCPILGSQFCVCEFYLHQQPDIVLTYHPMQFIEK